MNLWIGIGRLTRDPEIKYTEQNDARARFSVAINEKYGEKETTQFVECVAWRKTAESIGEYGRKGRLIMVQGRWQRREWETDQGEKRQVWEVQVDRWQPLDSNKPAQGEQSQNASPDLSDLPF